MVSVRLNCLTNLRITCYIRNINKKILIFFALLGREEWYWIKSGYQQLIEYLEWHPRGNSNFSII